MRDLVYRPLALSDLDGIADFIATESPRNASVFIGTIRQHVRRLTLFPEQGPARPDLGLGVRILPMMRRVVVVYRILDETIVILRVFWGGQDYQALMNIPDAGESASG